MPGSPEGPSRLEGHSLAWGLVTRGRGVRARGTVLPSARTRTKQTRTPLGPEEHFGGLQFQTSKPLGRGWVAVTETSGPAGRTETGSWQEDSVSGPDT